LRPDLVPRGYSTVFRSQALRTRTRSKRRIPETLSSDYGSKNSSPTLGSDPRSSPVDVTRIHTISSTPAVNREFPGLGSGSGSTVTLLGLGSAPFSPGIRSIPTTDQHTWKTADLPINADGTSDQTRLGPTRVRAAPLRQATRHMDIGVSGFRISVGLLRMKTRTP